LAWGITGWIANLFKKQDYADSTLKSEYVQQKIRLLENIVGYKIYNRSLYVKALTHRSFLEIHQELHKSNERLEFLGDSILSMVTARYLFDNHATEGEGFLTKARASLVNREYLISIAEEIGFDNVILYNQKYIRDSAYGLKNIMADGIEALIGAIFIDKGLKVTTKFINKRIIKTSSLEEEIFIDTNYKGQLLETSHARKLSAPHYKLRSEVGPAHNKLFTIEVYIGDDLYGVGTGSSKKSAEQEASKQALEKLNNHSADKVILK
jgi:ribonuclease III